MSTVNMINIIFQFLSFTQNCIKLRFFTKNHILHVFIVVTELGNIVFRWHKTHSSSPGEIVASPRTTVELVLKSNNAGKQIIVSERSYLKADLLKDRRIGKAVWIRKSDRLPVKWINLAFDRLVPPLKARLSFHLQR